MKTYYTTAYLARRLRMSQVQVQRLARNGTFEPDIRMAGIGKRNPMYGYEKTTVDEIVKERKK